MKRWVLLWGMLGCYGLASSQPRLEVSTEGYGLVPGVPGDAHGSGVALVDVDSDGDLDLYLGTERGEPDQLYIQTAAGEWIEQAVAVGITHTTRTRMALWFDYNADGRLDLLVSSDCDFDEEDCPALQGLRLYEQLSDFTFSEVTEAAGLVGLGPTRADQTFGGVAAADLNTDGYLDLVFGIRNGELYVLYNQGNGRFLREIQIRGFDRTENKYYQPALLDVEADGLVDVFCNVDFGPNELWWQQSDGTFEEVAQPAGVASAFNEMGVAVGDYDNDGDFDVYATNIKSFLGKDVYNILLRNDSRRGFPLFTEVAKGWGVDAGGWGWGATFMDLDRDGLLDLATTNGWDVGFEVVDASVFWLNVDTTFLNVSDSVGFNDSLLGGALVAGDLDRDGDQDLIQGLKGFTQAAELVRILENESANTHHWLTVVPRMEGTANHFAIGATVRAYADDRVQSRWIGAGGSFYGQEPAEAFFGLAATTVLDSVEVLWPGGARTVRYQVVADQVLTLTDGDLTHAPQRFLGQLEGNGFRLSWIDYSNQEDSYVLERSTTENFAEAMAIPLPADTESYLDTDLSINSVNYYRLRALGTEGVASAYSDTVATPFIVRLESTPRNAIRVYPNPTSGEGAVVISGLVNADESIRLIDAQGRRVPIQVAQISDYIFSLEARQALSPGIYWIQIGEEGITLLVR